MEELVSVIVPIFKAEAYIDECISSLIKQTYKALQIILVDDGSPDNCSHICDNWASKDDRILVIHKMNTGLSDSRNVGIESAKGKWIVFVDADDIVSENLIEALVHNKKEGSLVTCKFKRFDTMVEECPIKDAIAIETYSNKDYGRIRGGLYVWGTLYNSKLIKDHSIRFDVELSNLEDVVWNAVYCRYVDEIIFVNEELYFYRRTPNSITSNCVNREWQILSWLKARNSIEKQFVDRQSEQIIASGFKKELRRCTNNIYEECLAGDIDYKTLWNIKKEYQKVAHHSICVCGGVECLLETIFCGYIYYHLYILLLTIKHKIR